MSKESVLRQAIANDETLEITYVKFNGEQSRRTISEITPSDEWGEGYIHAYCHLRDDYRTFKISRITSINGIKYPDQVSTPSIPHIKTSSLGKTYTPSYHTSSSYSSSSYSSSNTSSSSSSSSGGCYIATMAYGDYDHPQVLVLREYRDKVLMNSLLGRAFVKVYYATSPHMVRLLRGHRRTNAMIRSTLDKFVEHLRTRKE